MPKQTIILLPVILAIVVVAVTLTARSCRAEPATDDCISKPNSTSPQGSHWYTASIARPTAAAGISDPKA